MLLKPINVTAIGPSLYFTKQFHNFGFETGFTGIGIRNDCFHLNGDDEAISSD